MRKDRREEKRKGKRKGDLNETNKGNILYYIV